MENVEALNMMRSLKTEAEKRGKKVKEMKYLGKISVEGEERDIYLMRELLKKQINGEIHEVDVDSYITEKLEKIAGNNHSDSYQYPMVVSKYTKEKGDIEEQLQDLDDEGFLDLGELELERKSEIAKAIGVKEEEIKEIDEMDLSQEVKKEAVVDKQDLKGIDIKEETKLSQYIKGATLENRLGLKEHGIEDGVTLARVSSSSLNKYLDKPTTQVDCFVVIRKDGSAVALGEDILVPDNRLGTNPTQHITTANVEQGEVEKEPITSSWRIVNGSGRDYLSVGYDESYGSHREIKFMTSSVKERDYVGIELETRYTWRQDEDIRQYMNERGEGTRTADNALERSRTHQLKDDSDKNCGKEEVQDIDNNKNNDTHEHLPKENVFDPEQKIPDTDMTWQELADKCKISPEEVYSKYQEKDDSRKTGKEIANEIEEDVNRRMGSSRKRYIEKGD